MIQKQVFYGEYQKHHIWIKRIKDENLPKFMPNRWYCAYIDVPHLDAEDNYDWLDALGGITYTGKLAQAISSNLERDIFVIGFDTNHFGMNDVHLREVVENARHLIDQLEEKRLRNFN